MGWKINIKKNQKQNIRRKEMETENEFGTKHWQEEFRYR